MDLLTIAIILFLIGLALGTAEIFIPSAGVLAILSVLAFVGSIICAFKVSAIWGMVFVIAAPLFMAVAIVKGFKILPRTWVGKRMILGTPPEDETNPDSAQANAATPAGTTSEAVGSDLVGQTGVARTDLRPAGSAQIADRRYNVVSIGDFIRQGARIRVIEVRGNRVVVEQVD
jgi:membrane-bound serine protease (ClpP class)